MKLSTIDLQELADIAIQAATEAGRMVARSRPEQVDHKDGAGSLAAQVVTEIDLLAEEIILELLNPTLERFELGLLSEETHDDGGRLTADYFWCIDPIDGTLPFIEGVPGYAVAIALVGRDGTPWIGAIYDPVESALFHAVRGAGSFRNRQAWPGKEIAGQDMLSVFANRSFLDADYYDVVMEELGQLANDRGLSGVELHTGAGAVMNTCWALASAPGFYFTVPRPVKGASLWDFAATACLFIEAGAVATDIHGAPLDLNREDSTYMNHRGALYATDEALADRVRKIFTRTAE